MLLKDLKVNKKKRIKRKRVARGAGSGLGKTAGRGENGQKSRSGGTKNPWFEGGQQRLPQRIPKVGFNSPFRKEYQILNVGLLNEKFEARAEVNAKILFEKGLVKSKRKMINILGEGKIEKALKITADKFSKSAVEKIKKSGGEATEIK